MKHVRFCPPPGRRACLALLLFFAACQDVTEPSPPVEERGVVLNSLELSLTIFSVEDPGQTVTVGLGPEGSPVSLAVTGRWAAVPLGFVPALAVVDLDEAALARTVPLPAGSGATGVAFLTDSTVLVANPALNSVTPVNVRTGEVGAEIGVGTYPQVVALAGDRVAVINAELGPDFQPSGPGTITVLDRPSLAVLGTVTLSGENPGAAVPGPGGLLYVVNSGRFGFGDGSVSVVDLVGLDEVEHHGGFGEFPFSAAFPPGQDLLHVGSFGYGLAVWDAGSETFLRAPDAAITPEGIPSVSGHAFDLDGRLYTLRPDCSAPSVAHRLLPSYEVEISLPVGLCPIAIAFTPEGG